MKFNLKIMHQHFLYYYILAHLVLLSFIVGWSVRAFVVLSGGGVSVPDASGDERAVVGNNIIDSRIAAATSSAYARQVVRVAGGCELWESTDFFRMDRWGKATSSPYPDSSMICNCPAGFDKVQIRTTQDTIQNFASGNWYNRSTHFGGNLNSPELCTFDPFAAHESVRSCRYNSIGPDNGYNKFCVRIRCDEGCDCVIGTPCYGTEEITRKNNFFDFAFKIQPAKADLPLGCSIGMYRVGCGFILKCQHHDLPVGQPTTITTWLCINTSATSTLTGWHN